ncbi:MAG: 50S ribosomal protein L11, partial [Anaerolineae bacterium]|nr:50S ribosomal protein L11 [Anaerolineae bacterium]
AFCKEYNARTSTRIGEIVPAEITVFSDGSFKFELKSPPTTFLIQKAAGISKGSARPNAEKVGTITRKQVREIAEVKIKDMNTSNYDSIMRQIEGTARNMGVEVVD